MQGADKNWVLVKCLTVAECSAVSVNGESVDLNLRQEDSLPRSPESSSKLLRMGTRILMNGTSETRTFKELWTEGRSAPRQCRRLDWRSRHFVLRVGVLSLEGSDFEFGRYLTSSVNVCTL